MKYLFYSALLSATIVSIVLAIGVVTPFVSVDIGMIECGKTLRVKGPGGDGVLLFNKEATAVHVQMDVQVPDKNIVHAGFDALPDARWIGIEPHDFVIPAHGQTLCAVTLLVPKERRFRHHYYEAYLRTRMTPTNETRMEIVGALQSRLRFGVK